VCRCALPLFCASLLPCPSRGEWPLLLCLASVLWRCIPVTPFPPAYRNSVGNVCDEAQEAQAVLEPLPLPRRPCTRATRGLAGCGPCVHAAPPSPRSCLSSHCRRPPLPPLLPLLLLPPPPSDPPPPACRSLLAPRPGGPLSLPSGQARPWQPPLGSNPGRSMARSGGGPGNEAR
jgi:hypothetical protein